MANHSFEVKGKAMNWDDPEEVAKERARLVRNVEEADKKYEKALKVMKWSHYFVIANIILAVFLALLITIFKLMK